MKERIQDYKEIQRSLYYLGYELKQSHYQQSIFDTQTQEEEHISLSDWRKVDEYTGWQSGLFNH
jgi:hypothetical protein